MLHHLKPQLLIFLNKNVDNQTYDILEAAYNFNKINNLKEDVLIVEVNKKISESDDLLKNLISAVRTIQTQDINVEDTLTRTELTTGSISNGQSGCVVYTRTIGSSFILGHNHNGELGDSATAQDGGGQVILGDHRTAEVISFSGCYEI